MMFHRLGLIKGLINKNQKGFTLIELVIAIAITGIISGSITTAIFQVYSGSTRSSNHMTAIKQVQNAGYWVSRDALMAQSLVPAGTSGFPLTLSWAEWGGGVNQVDYDLTADNKLQRSHSVDGDTETSIVAQFIDPDETHCGFTTGGAFSLPDDTDVFTISGGLTADSGTITVTAGSVTATPTGGATVYGGTDPVIIVSGSGAVVWETPSAGDTIVVAADLENTEGIWISTTAAATATMTVDDDGDATVAASGILVFRFTVTATVGSGSQLESETRVYEVAPRSGL